MADHINSFVCWCGKSPSVQPAPRFKVGDRVRVVRTGQVACVREYYALSQHHYKIGDSGCDYAEGELLSAPVVCAPDGTRCAWWKSHFVTCIVVDCPPRGEQQVQALKRCPDCDGRLHP